MSPGGRHITEAGFFIKVNRYLQLMLSELCKNVISCTQQEFLVPELRSNYKPSILKIVNTYDIYWEKERKVKVIHIISAACAVKGSFF